MQTDYIETRLKDQMGYYERMSKKLRNEYYWLSSISIVINAAIPVLSMGIDTAGVLKYIIALLSATASVLSSFLLLRKTKDTWVRYRSTYEKLRSEQALFETSSGRYKTADEKDFILACEEIMELERNAWEELLQNSQEKRA